MENQLPVIPKIAKLKMGKRTQNNCKRLAPATDHAKRIFANNCQVLSQTFRHQTAKKQQ